MSWQRQLTHVNGSNFNPCQENDYEDFATFLGISLRRSFHQLARRSSILSMVRHIQRPRPRRQLRVCNFRTVHGVGERSWRILRAKSATRANLPNKVFDWEKLQELHLSLLISPKSSAFCNLRFGLGRWRCSPRRAALCRWKGASSLTAEITIEARAIGPMALNALLGSAPVAIPKEVSRFGLAVSFDLTRK